MLGGGTQNILLRFTREAQDYILRRPPFALRPSSNETMRREARLLSARAGSPVPHPALIAACGEEDVLGAASYLMAPVNGFNATTGLPKLHADSPTARRRMGLAMVEALAKLGRDRLPCGADELRQARQLFGAAGAAMANATGELFRLPSCTGPGRSTGCGPGRALARNTPSGKISPRHRPWRLPPGQCHVPAGRPRTAAIVDWELSTIGDPLLDPGWLLATWPEGDTPGSADVALTPWSGFPNSS